MIYKPTLYLVRGVPGSGKSTLAWQLYHSGLVHYVFEADEYFIQEGEYKSDPTRLYDAHQWCQRRARDALNGEYNVCVSNTSTTKEEVDRYIQIANETGAVFVSLIVENYHGGENIHGVSPKKIQQMKDRFHVNL